MVGCILTGHGTFAEGVGSALEMVGGPQENFEVVTFLESESAEFPAKIADAIARMAATTGEVVVFCDLMGGTPFNQAMMATATTPGVQVVAGANLPMLLECLPFRTPETTADEIVANALEIGRMGIDSKKLELDGDSGEDDLFADDEEGL